MRRTMSTALVVGATGSLGSALTDALLARGWRVRALHRSAHQPSTATRPGAAIEWVRGDAMRAVDLERAAAGTQLIVHATNPPDYHDWAGLAAPMLDNSIAAARRSGARLLLPGTIYNFDPALGPLLTEDAPEHPPTRKGAVRVAMERRLRAAAADGVRSLIVRAGDFFGPAARNSWLTRAIVRPGRSARALWYPGPIDVGHSWAYLPDLAEAAMRLVEQDLLLSDLAVFHFRGHFVTGRVLADAIAGLPGLRGSRAAPFPWWVVALASPFVESMRETLEMRYLWHTALQLDNRRLRATIGDEPHTPLELALQQTLVPAAPEPTGRAAAGGARGRILAGCAVGLASSMTPLPRAVAADGDPVQVAASLAVSDQAQAGLDRGGNLEVPSLTARLSVSRALAVDVDAGLAIEDIHRRYEFSGSGPVAALLPWKDVHEVSLSAPLLLGAAQRWSYLIAPSVGLQWASGADLDRSLTYGGLLAAIRSVAANEHIGLGLTALDQIRDLQMLPVLVVDWALGERLRVTNTEPGSPMGDEGIELVRQSGFWAAAAGAAYRFDRFRLTQHGDAADGIGEQHGEDVYLRAQRRLGAHFSLELHAGLLLGSRVRVEDSGARLLAQDSLRPAPLAGIHVAGRF